MAVVHETAEVLRARREMLNHLGQRQYPLSERVMKRFRKQPGGHVWRGLLKDGRTPKRILHMPGTRR